MRLQGHQRRPTTFVGESDHHGRTPLATEIVQRAHRAGLVILDDVEVVKDVGRDDRP